MNIFEAMKAADGLYPCISRKYWIDSCMGESLEVPRVYPTNTPDGCYYNGSDCACRPWIPKKEDLLEDDWITVTFFGTLDF